MIDAERAVLRPLPMAPAMTWETMTVRVTSASGFMCRHVFYTVPSRLVGHRLHLRIHDDRIEVYLTLRTVVRDTDNVRTISLIGNC